MASSATLLKSARLFHLYSGVFLAPALIFFAFTGGLQTFSYHETTRGSSYKPPAILVKLGQLHKKQTFVLPERKGPPPNAAPAPQAAIEQPARTNQHTIDLSHLGDHTNQQKHDRLDNPGTPPVATPPASTSSAPPADPAPKKQNLLPMKIFFLVASVGLFFSTLTGLYMSYRFARNRAAITASLVAGIVIPLIILYFQ